MADLKDHDPADERVENAPAEPEPVAPRHAQSGPVEEPVELSENDPVLPSGDPAAAATEESADWVEPGEPAEDPGPAGPIGTTDATDRSAEPVTVVESDEARTEAYPAGIEPRVPADDAETVRERVVYVQAPTPPKPKGNRGIGVLVAVVATLVYAVVLALAGLGLTVIGSGRIALSFLGSASFLVPVLLFLVAAIVLALLANRAGWWAHVLGSLVVGLFVYFGTIGILLLFNNVVLLTPSEAGGAFRAAMLNAPIIMAGLLAREVALWSGAITSARGRRVRERNAEARAAFDREQAEAPASVAI